MAMPDPDDDTAVMRYYNPQNAYYDDDEFDEDLDLEELASVSPEAPADFSDNNRDRDVPTSSTYAKRPRTVAASYDKARQVLTVVFRDGTLWNYYQVTPGEWQNFHNSISKGRPWLNAGGPFTRKPNGPADMTNLPPEVTGAIYAEARRAQLRYVTKYRYKTGATRTVTSKSGKKYTYDVSGQRVSKTKLKAAGKNTATANKPKRP